MKLVNCLCSDGRTRQYVGEGPDLGAQIRNEDDEWVTVENKSHFTSPVVFNSQEAWLEFCKRGVGNS